MTALSSLATHIRTAYAEPGNREAREAMMLGAHQAGIAFSNASVTLIHGMSRPIGAFFHVPHGLSNAMLLPRITEFSIPGCPERYADCAVAMDFAAADAPAELACEQLLQGLYQLCADLQVPTLSGFGVDAARFEQLVPTMAEQALASGSPANNPRLPEQADVEALYRQVWA